MKNCGPELSQLKELVTKETPLSAHQWLDLLTKSMLTVEGF